jgi:hypothetical protein
LQALSLLSWSYLALFGYLFINVYVSIIFVRAEEKRGIKNTDTITTLIELITYPIGIFFINKRLKKLLS